MWSNRPGSIFVQFPIVNLKSLLFKNKMNYLGRGSGAGRASAASSGGGGRTVLWPPVTEASAVDGGDIVVPGGGRTDSPEIVTPPPSYSQAKILQLSTEHLAKQVCFYFWDFQGHL